MFEVLDVFFWWLKASPVVWTSFMQFLIKKKFQIFFSAGLFFQIFGHKTVDPDRYSA